MSYKSKFGLTEIIPRVRNNLVISWDLESEDWDEINQKPVGKLTKFPILLFTPNLNNTKEHYHIDLSREQAILLKEWLDAYIEDTK